MQVWWDIAREFATPEMFGGLVLGAAPVWLGAWTRSRMRRGRLKTDIAGELIAIQEELATRANLKEWGVDDPRFEWMLSPLERQIDRQARLIQGERLSTAAETSARAYHLTVKRFTAAWAGAKKRGKAFWDAYDETDAACRRVIEDLGRRRRFKSRLAYLDNMDRRTDDGPSARPSLRPAEAVRIIRWAAPERFPAGPRGTPGRPPNPPA
jgi:hypothetical protein